MSLLFSRATFWMIFCNKNLHLFLIGMTLSVAMLARNVQVYVTNWRIDVSKPTATQSACASKDEERLQNKFESSRTQPTAPDCRLRTRYKHRTGIKNTTRRGGYFKPVFQTYTFIYTSLVTNKCHVSQWNYDKVRRLMCNFFQQVNTNMPPQLSTNVSINIYMWTKVKLKQNLSPMSFYKHLNYSPFDTNSDFRTNEEFQILKIIH